VGIDIPVIADDQVPPGTVALVSAGRDENGEVRVSAAVAVNVAPVEPAAQAAERRDVASFEVGGNGPFREAPRVNGHQLTSVMSFKVEAEAGELPVVTVRLLPAELLKLQFGDVIVAVDGETREALVSLGWTPPAEP
jgi:hypothetical protein